MENGRERFRRAACVQYRVTSVRISYAGFQDDNNTYTVQYIFALHNTQLQIWDDKPFSHPTFTSACPCTSYEPVSPSAYALHRFGTSSNRY
jgi:hypothetical protein